MMKIRRFKNLCQLRLSSRLYRQKRGHNRPIYVRVEINPRSFFNTTDVNNPFTAQNTNRFIVVVASYSSVCLTACCTSCV